MPNNRGPFTVRIEGVDASDNELNLSASRRFVAVPEVVLLPAISISAPANNSEVESGANFTVNVAYENADGFAVSFTGQSQTVMNATSVTLTAPTVTADTVSYTHLTLPTIYSV